MEDFSNEKTKNRTFDINDNIIKDDNIGHGERSDFQDLIDVEKQCMNETESPDNNFEEKTKSENLVEANEYKAVDDSFEDLRKVMAAIVIDLFKNVLKIEEKSLKDRGVRDLTITEVHAISAVGTGSGKSMSEVAEALNITMGTLTTTMTKLERKGYVQRMKASGDRRVVIAKLTKTGRWVEKVYRNFHDEMIEHLIIDLKLDENQNLIQALKNINEFFLREYGI